MATDLPEEKNISIINMLSTDYLLKEYCPTRRFQELLNGSPGTGGRGQDSGENPKGNKEVWESRERCRLLSL